MNYKVKKNTFLLQIDTRHDNTVTTLQLWTRCVYTFNAILPGAVAFLFSFFFPFYLSKLTYTIKPVAKTDLIPIDFNVEQQAKNNIDTNFIIFYIDKHSAAATLPTIFKWKKLVQICSLYRHHRPHLQSQSA